MKYFTLLAATLLAIGPSLQAETWTGSSDVTFKGTSTLHDFEGNVRAVPLVVTVKTSEKGRLISATSAVEITRMSTAEKDRDQNMWKMFNAAKHRLMKITVPETPESALRPVNGKPGAMPITLTIAGTPGTVTGAVSNLKEMATTASFDLQFPVSLKAFNLKPPSTLVGLIKVGDTVSVSVHVTLTRQKS
jgi:hypothetical protein